MELKLDFEPRPQSADVQILTEGLTEHALPFTMRPGFVPAAVFLRCDDAVVWGGITGSINWNWLHVQLLWVHPEMASQGHGGRLLASLEQHATEQGCRYAHVETFSFQAAAFYERHGYREFARLADYPPGYEQVYLKKTLDD